MSSENSARQMIPTDESELEDFVQEKLAEYYQAGKPPWDTDVPPPELVDLVTGGDAASPGSALDLGCGTGTNSIYLADHGWDVVGVDLIDLAIEQSQVKADAAGVPVTLLCGDVTRLDELEAAGPFDLVFDLSCYCGIPTHRRDAYAHGVTARTTAGARLLMFGYGPGVFDDGYTGVTADELGRRFGGWDLVDVTPGTNPFPTNWFTLRRNSAG